MNEMGRSMTRRGFICGSAAVLGSTVAGSAAAAESVEEIEWTNEADVVVVGLGGAGGAAAVEALAGGATVCVIERGGRGGGCTARCGGLIYMGGGTGLQERLGVEDTPEAFSAYIQSAVGPTADPELLDVFCQNSVGLYDWCVEQGMTFEGGLLAEDHVVEAPQGISLHYSGNERSYRYASSIPPAPRGHTPTGGGMGIFEALEAKVDAGAEVLYSTRAETLVTNAEGRVVGVFAQQEDGTQVAVLAHKAVVLTCGPFTYNDAMMDDCSPTWRLAGARTGTEFDQGDGIRMAQRIGAATRNICDVNYARHVYLYGALSEGAMLNQDGFRFLSEDWYGSWIGREIVNTTPDCCYIVLDDESLTAAMATPYGAYLPPAIDADTFEDLAEAMGMPVEHVLQSIERYNAYCEAGEDGDYHKDPMYLKPIATPPFHAVPSGIATTAVMSLGGLKINADAQVIDLNGAPIPGLYAAGRTSCGIFGLYAGSGTSVADCLTFGRIAGANAAK